MSSIKNDKKSIFRSAILVTGATIVDKLLFFSLNIIIARYLSVPDFGEYTTALEYATFFSMFSNVGINQALIRTLSLNFNNPGLIRLYFSNSLFVKLPLAILVYCIMAFSLLFTSYSPNTVKLVLLLGLVRIANEFCVSIYSFYDAHEKFSISTLVNMSFSISFVTAAAAVVYLKGSTYGIVYSRLGIVLFFTVILIISIRKWITIKPDRVCVKEIIITAVPFGLYGIFSNIIQRSSIILLSNIKSVASIGIFNNGYLFLTVLGFIPNSINRVLVPYLYKSLKDNNMSRFQFAMDIFSKFFAVLSCYIALVLIILAHPLIELLYGPQYHETSYILQMVALAIPFIFNMPSIILTAIDEQRLNQRILLATAMVSISSGFILIKLIDGLSGAVFSVIITHSFCFFLSHYVLHNRKSITVTKGLVSFGSACLILILSIAAYQLFFSGVFWLWALGILSLLYFTAVLLIIVRHDDIRIISEVLFSQKK